MSDEKVYRFASRWLGLTKWLGNKKIKFAKGQYKTTDGKIAAFLRDQKEVQEIKSVSKPDKEVKKSSK